MKETRTAVRGLGSCIYRAYEAVEPMKDPPSILLFFLIFILSKPKSVLEIWIHNRIFHFLDNYFKFLNPDSGSFKSNSWDLMTF